MKKPLLPVLVLLTLLAMPWPASVLAQTRFDFDRTPGNLPKTVVPVRYALQLTLDPAQDEFSAQVEIDVDVRAPVAAVVLHARDLQASRIELRSPGAAARSLQPTAGPVSQSWWLEPVDAAPIVAGRYTLSIAYTGRVNSSGAGLFRAPHRVAGEPRGLLATQLEAVDARSVFPCFDEPAFRAVFDLTVRAPRGFDVLANMPLAGAPRPDGDAVVHRFQPTPPMPSYLFAVSVGRYDTLAGRAAGVPLRILTAPGKRAHAGYAMGATRQVVPFYDRYFGVPYALPKLDQLAVPSVRVGAMEDWGLISYSENNLLYDPAKSSPATQRRIYSIVAHEIAHQWFGNLVTAAWWDEIWLNEAFATWMGNKVTARFNPGWRNGLEQRHPLDRTMAGDAGGATRAIRSGAVSESAVFDVFDDITYVKGGSVLGMLEQWLGAEPFRRGLAAYMQERRFSNATAGDLWFHMAKASQRDVAAVAASWTDQPGFPLVQVAAECVEGAGSAARRTRVTLSQRRLRDGAEPAPAGIDVQAPPLWRIPVRLARAGGAASTVLLSASTQTVDLPGCGGAPLLANAGGVGFYRVKYEPAQLDALTGRFARVPPADQVTLFSDVFALAQVGELPLARWLALVERLPGVAGAARATLFELAGNGFAFLDEAMAGTPAQAAVRAAARRALAPELARLGWVERRSDDAQTTKLRGALIERLARFDDAGTTERALRAFDDHDAGRTPLPASIQSAVMRAAGLHADRARFDRLLARFKAAGGEEDRWLYASALAGGRDKGRASELLAASLTGLTTPNIAIALPGLVAERSPFGTLAYDFALANWDALARIAGNAMFGRFGLLPEAATGFNEPARAAQLVADQRAKTGPDGAVPAARTAARIALLAAVRQRESATLQALPSSP